MRVLLIDHFRHSCENGYPLNLARELNRRGIPAAALFTAMPGRARRDHAGYYRKYPLLVTPSGFRETCLLIQKLKISLLHLHSLSLLPLAARLTEALNLPFGLTVQGPIKKESLPALRRAAFIIATNTPVFTALKEVYPQTVFLPAGIDLDEFKPCPQRDRFIITFIGEDYSEESYLAFFKAVTLIDIPLQIISPQPPPITGGLFHGWLPDRAPVLAESQVLAGRGRALLEGMACGNAALRLGEGYGGILDPAPLTPPAEPAFSPAGDRAACYRDIFFDLSRLLKDRPYLERLQERGRRLVRENYDLRLIAERTAEIYRGGLGKKKSGRGGDAAANPAGQ